jgi:ATP-dependent DNA helicase RecG
MTKEEFIDRLDRDIEWTDFEVKKASSELPKSAWETVSAFSNTSGGWIIFGVEQKGKKFSILGVSNPEKIEQDFTNTLASRQKFNVLIRPQAEKYEIDGAIVLAFFIPPSSEKPVYYQNNTHNTFIRSASGDQRATQAEVDAMHRNRAYGSWDRETIPNANANDLIEEDVYGYIGYLKAFNPNHPYNGLSRIELLHKLHALRDGFVTRAGALFFGSDELIARLVADFRVDFIEIAGESYTAAGGRHSFRLPEEQNLYRYYFSIYKRLVTNHLSLKYEVNDQGFGVEDSREAEAVREALVNLLMHTDYASPEKPRVRVFSDRIEFHNPGALPKDVQTILNEDYTAPRNPELARMFRTVRLAENAGQGFGRIVSGWKADRKVEPTITSDLLGVSIVFPLAPAAQQELVQELEQELQQELESSFSNSSGDGAGNTANTLYFKSLDEIIDFANETSNQVSNQVSDQVSVIIKQQVGERALDVLAIVATSPKSSAEILEAMDLSRQTKNKKKHIDPLLDLSWIAYTIPKNPKHRNQKYTLSEAGKKLSKLLKN